MEQESRGQLQSFTSYKTAVNKYDCMCQILPLRMSENVEGNTQQYKDMIEKVNTLGEQHRNIHQSLLKLINNINDSIENIEASKDEFKQMIRKQQFKCKSALHLKAQKEIILGRIQNIESNVLINKLKHQLQRKYQEMQSSERESPKQLDTTFQQQSFLQIEKIEDSPFVASYKASVFEKEYVVYRTKEYQITSKRGSDGMEVQIINFDGEYRVISIDEGVPCQRAFIGWEKFGNGKFLSDCKIIPEQTEIPIPLPISYAFQRRLIGILSPTAFESIKHRLTHKKKLVIKKDDQLTSEKTNELLESIGARKYNEGLVSIFKRLKGENQLYMIEGYEKGRAWEITIKGLKETPFFNDIVQFMIFMLSS